eukprot:TRINITY_DN5133_c0_g1_i1.p1 TRINITY_DN5133_c0_g1~~TRINITY_DN5133_c0_g1_i1.p1  ORF type:complete len:553 (+),score=147.61 TRINITY_DN5133_c0_g1_i1:91-1659(+)
MRVSYRTPPPRRAAGEVELPAGATVGQLRGAVAAALGVGPSEVRLAARGTMLSDDAAPADGTPSVVACLVARAEPAAAPRDPPPPAIPTVCGAVAPGAVSGAVLASAFVAFDFTPFAAAAAGSRWPAAGTAAPAGEELEELRCEPLQRLDNFRAQRHDLAAAQAELTALHRAGCRLVVCMATASAGRDIDTLRALSRATGVEIVASTGVQLAPPFALPAPAPEAAPAFPGVAALRETLERELCCGTGALPACGAVTFTPRPDGSGPSMEALAVCAAAAAAAGCPLTLALPHPCAAELLGALLDKVAGTDPAPPTTVLAGALGRVDLPPSGWAALLGRHGPWLGVAADCVGWGGLHRDGRHLLGGDALPASALRELVAAVPADRLVLGSYHCMKLCTAAWGGPGMAALLREGLPRVLEPAVGGSERVPFSGRALGALAFWRPPPEAPPEVKHWQCSWCSKEQEEKAPDESFRRLEYRYCSIGCLREHERQLDAARPDQGRGGGGRRQQQQGDGLGAWGVPASR